MINREYPRTNRYVFELSKYLQKALENQINSNKKFEGTQRTSKELQIMNTKEKEIEIYPDGRLDTNNAARYLEKSVKTLAIWRSQGISPKFKKIRGRVFYYKSDLDEWLDSFKRCTSTAQARLGEV
ncbi:MAG TPA: helix-turn-helix domain-containing protein [Vampirovibrionales bacterium]